MSATLEELQQKTVQIEVEKDRKQAERAEKRRKQEQIRRCQTWEKLVAPIILIITILVSAVIYFL